MEMTQDERQALEWAIRQQCQSVAADYARCLAEYIERQQEKQQQPNRIVIVTGLSDPYITEIQAERPDDVVIIVYSLNNLTGTVFDRHYIRQLTIADLCEECKEGWMERIGPVPHSDPQCILYRCTECDAGATVHAHACPECHALIPADNQCWYCENRPDDDPQAVGQ